MVRLRDLGKWVGGNTPSKANAAYWANGTVPWVSPKDMKVEEIASSQDRITEAALNAGRVALVPEGSVLFVTRSGILSHTLPVAITKLSVTINQDLKALTPKPDVSPKYVAHAVREASRRILKQCSKHGTTVASIETNALLDFEIPIVSLDDQHRIVAEIEKQFSRRDKAVANLKRVKANLKRYKASVLKAAVEGRLVPTEAELACREGRTYETGRQLLQRLMQAHYGKPTGNSNCKAADRPNTFGLPQLPEGWTWSALPQVGELSRGKSKHRPRDDAKLYDGPYPFIQTGDVRRSEGTICEFSQTYNEFGLKQSRLWPAGTLCITIAANIAETGILTMPACFPDSIVGFLSDNVAITRFVEYFIRTIRADIARYASATAQKNINLAVLEGVVISFPPLAEQHRIVAEVDRRLSIVREVESEVDANLKRAQALRQAVLARAFAPPPTTGARQGERAAATP